MIVDIGGGSTEIAVISLGGIVCNNPIRVAGDDLTADIQEYGRAANTMFASASVWRNVLRCTSVRL